MIVSIIIISVIFLIFSHSYITFRINSVTIRKKKKNNNDISYLYAYNHALSALNSLTKT